MKITDLYIENFGKLHQLHYAFTQPITQIFEENGFGKTTFAAFLKAMFYGLPTIRQNAKESNDREQYAPFNGGKFGGNINFLYQDKNYRIERFFDKKSEKKDSLKVYCNGREMQHMDGNLGKVFFELDKESFEKTTFVTAEFLESATTTAMQEKLGQFIDDTTSDCNYSTAIEKLEKAKKELKYNKGKGGKIYELECKQKACYTALNECNQLTKKLEQEYATFNALKVAVEKEQVSMQNNADKVYALKRYAEYQQKIEVLQQQIIKIKADYIHGLPTSLEIEQLKELTNQLLQLKKIGVQNPLSTESVQEYQKLQQQFSCKLPTENDLQNATLWITKRTELQAELTARQKTVPTQNTPQESPKTHSLKKHIYWIEFLKFFLFILGSIGIISAMFVTNPTKLALLAIGATLFLLASIWTLFGNKKKKTFSTTKQQESNAEKIVANQHTIESTTLQEELVKYTSLLENFFKEYGYTDGAYFQNLTHLQYNIAHYKNLQQAMQQQNNNSLQVDRESIAIQSQIHTLLQKYSMTMQTDWQAQMRQLEESRKAITQLQKQKELEEQEAKAYCIKHHIEEKEDGTQNTTPTNTLEQKRQELARLSNRIAEIEQQLYLRSSYENELEEITEKLANFNEQYTLLTHTIDALMQAEENLKNRYLRPLQNKLERYGLQQHLGIHLQLDSTYALHFDSFGEKHSSKHLSNGQRTLALFVLRLALMDSLCQAVQPPLILDDPFLHLDAQNIAFCNTILHTVAKDRQIIYFCCHSSRQIL